MRPELLQKLHADKNSDKVNLSRMSIKDNEVAEIITTIHRIKPTTSKIDLDDNLLSDRGAEILADALQEFDECRELSVQFNGIDQQGIIALVELKKNYFPHLQLFLHGNKMTNVFDLEVLMNDSSCPQSRK